MQTRREFLGTLGIASVGAVVLACTKANGQASTPPTAMPIGIQLYTLRSLLERDFDGTLARVAEIGYREVEFAGYYKRTPAQVREVLHRTGLTAPSAHIPLPASDDVWTRALDDARVIGHEWIVLPWLDPAVRPRTAADWSRFATRLNQLGTLTKNAGLRFSYHNHDFELASNGSDTFLDLLLAQTDPALVNFEMDVYWVTKAGADPLALMAKYPGRFPLLHLKDASPAPERRIVDVGSGTIDWRVVLKTARAQGLTHAFVEHDQPADPLGSARTSFTYLSTLKS
jgi:sugar phosphate isomerase/epimerase